MDPNIQEPRVQSWNVTLEKQLREDWSVTANYLGRYSDHLWAEVGINPGVYMGLGPCVINGASFPVCSTNANLNQRRKFSIENPRQGACSVSSISTTPLAGRPIRGCGSPSRGDRVRAA
jgi:hypothetical protein